jgi:hypothetical protein
MTDTLPHLALVGVCGCSVDEPVADLDCLLDCPNSLGRRTLKDAKPERGQGNAVVAA